MAQFYIFFACPSVYCAIYTQQCYIYTRDSNELRYYRDCRTAYRTVDFHACASVTAAAEDEDCSNHAGFAFIKFATNRSVCRLPEKGTLLLSESSKMVSKTSYVKLTRTPIHRSHSLQRSLGKLPATTATFIGAGLC